MYRERVAESPEKVSGNPMDHILADDEGHGLLHGAFGHPCHITPGRGRKDQGAIHSVALMANGVSCFQKEAKNLILSIFLLAHRAASPISIEAGKPHEAGNEIDCRLVFIFAFQRIQSPCIEAVDGSI